MESPEKREIALLRKDVFLVDGPALLGVAVSTVVSSAEAVSSILNAFLSSVSLTSAKVIPSVLPSPSSSISSLVKSDPVHTGIFFSVDVPSTVSSVSSAS